MMRVEASPGVLRFSSGTVQGMCRRVVVLTCSEPAYSPWVGQLSFFSAESQPPDIGDLAGLLAGPGLLVTAGDLVRLSVIVDAEWRARAVVEAITATGLAADHSRSDQGNWLVRTDYVAELGPLAAAWTTGAIKSVPAQWAPADRQLRLWALAAGHGEYGGERFVLGLDPHAPATHSPLAKAMMQLGLAATLIAKDPALRISGRKRLARLAFHIGEPPPGADWGWSR